MREHNHSVSIWDKLGISLSVLCAVHCLTFPILFSLLPLWHGSEALEGWVHVAFLILIVPTIYLVLKVPHPKHIAFYLISGFLVLVSALFVGIYINETAETVITLIGSSLLITGHWKNYKATQMHTH